MKSFTENTKFSVLQKINSFLFKLLDFFNTCTHDINFRTQTYVWIFFLQLCLACSYLKIAISDSVCQGSTFWLVLFVIKEKNCWPFLPRGVLARKGLDKLSNNFFFLFFIKVLKVFRWMGRRSHKKAPRNTERNVCLSQMDHILTYWNFNSEKREIVLEKKRESTGISKGKEAKKCVCLCAWGCKAVDSL